ncbi:TfpX/TfpZ family type IV pilin accessory protein [Candidatus Methylocalor cossyra]|uniref:Fimbrial assembly protein, serogroup I n=1 Tax=Candidatus Methylocalor cossyra TaxID=3108543 RepID=A0ABP1C7Q5_9GAMM
MSRWRAAAYHFGISLSVLSALAVALTLTWYPPEYLSAVGGKGLMALLAGVDACLGPLLTLIVFDVRKPRLKLDLAIIAGLQVVALAYGLRAAFLARPVYMVFAVDRFELVTAKDITADHLARARRAEFRSLPLRGPKLVAAHRPDTLEERQKLLFSAALGGVDLPQLPEYYVPYEELAPEVVRRGKPVETLLARNDQARQLLDTYLKAHRLEPAKVRCLPLRGPKNDQTVLVAADTAQVLGILDLPPW